MYKFLLVLLIPATVLATNGNGKHTKNKVINKEYKVSKDATLIVSNKYGNIDIITGNGNVIEIEVNIIVNGDDEDKVKQRLDQIDVEFNNNSSNVSAKTVIEKTTSSWKFWGKKNMMNIEINYTIKMPVTNNVDLSNDYGGISLDRLEGSSEINCDYGKITIGELLNSDNDINIDYLGKSSIDYIKDGDINADYSFLSIEKADNIDLNADYSQISFGKVSNLDFNCDYGDLVIEDAGKITGNSDYMSTSIKVLSGSANFNVDYGAIKIESFGANFKKLDIESSYAPIKLGLNLESSFNFEANLGYANLKGADELTFNKKNEKSSSKYYEGYYNSSNSGSYIYIKSNYGNITFIK